MLNGAELRNSSLVHRQYLELKGLNFNFKEVHYKWRMTTIKFLRKVTPEHKKVENGWEIVDLFKTGHWLWHMEKRVFHSMLFIWHKTILIQVVIFSTLVYLITVMIYNFTEVRKLRLWEWQNDRSQYVFYVIFGHPSTTALNMPPVRQQHQETLKTSSNYLLGYN